jgi:hypothetical protein
LIQCFEAIAYDPEEDECSSVDQLAESFREFLELQKNPPRWARTGG